jgi:hypothetical protein
MFCVPGTSGIPVARRSSADHSVRAANGGIDRLAVAQLGRDGGQLRIADGELAGRAHDCNHLLTAPERLLDHVAAGAARGAEDEDAPEHVDADEVSAMDTGR